MGPSHLSVMTALRSVFVPRFGRHWQEDASAAVRWIFGSRVRPLDGAVRGLGAGVRHAGDEQDFDCWPPVADGGSELVGLGQGGGEDEPAASAARGASASERW